MKDAVRNAVICLLIAALSSLAAFVGFCHPVAINAAAGTATSAISIIFGLSLALITIASQPIKIGETFAVDKFAQRSVAMQLNFDDSRTVLRQKLVLLLFILAVISGVSLQVAFEIDKEANWTRYISAMFSFLSSMSLLSALFIPFSVASKLARNREIGE